MTLLEVRDLSVSFVLRDGTEVPAVRSASWSLAAGERVGLVGESGSGKTTLVLALMGLLPPNALVRGSILLDGVDLLAAGEAGLRRARWRDIAMVFQGSMNALNPLQRVGTQVAEPLVAHGLAGRDEAAERAGVLLEQVGLPPRGFSAYPHELSGGMRQRAVIAMALACRPRVLVADEPTTSLDVVVQAQVLDLVRDLSEQLGLALVLVSHDLAIVGSLCERALVLRSGEVVESGPVRRLFTAGRDPYTRALVASVPTLRPRRPGAGAATRGVGAGGGVGGDRPPALRLEHLRVIYGGRRQGRVVAVEDASLEVAPGEIVALVGASGSGKTTAGLAALGLVGAEAGRVECLGRPLAAWKGRRRRELRRRAQMLYQDPYGSLDPLWQVGRILAEPLVVHRLEPDAARRRARATAALERVGLAPAATFLDRYPYELSGGQRQRVAIAALLVAEPELIVADEPVSMVDATMREGILALLSSLARDGIAILLITHDLPSCVRHADRLVVMREGRVVEEGRPAEIVERPRHPYTKELIAAVPARPGEFAGARAGVGGHDAAWVALAPSERKGSAT